VTPAVRHGLQAMVAGGIVAVVGLAWIVALAFGDRDAIAGWPLAVFLGGMLAMLGGIVRVELYVRRRP